MVTPLPDTLRSLLDESRTDVWRYARLLEPAVAPEHRVELGEGRVPCRVLRAADLPGALVVQREDLNPNGSHKDRSLAFQVSVYAARGVRTLAISSSGNAALSAAAACRVARLDLVAFVSPATPAPKIGLIARLGATVVTSERAIGLCKELCEAAAIPNIRPSVDDLALEGYKTLAFELVERALPCDSVFCYTTSGSTLTGMARGFEALRGLGWAERQPALHAAQAGAIASIAEAFGRGPVSQTAERSIIRDLGTRRTRRKGELVRAIRASAGSAWHVDDEAILLAREWLLDRGVHAGLESACATACALAAWRSGVVERPLVLLTGHYGHEAGVDAPSGSRTLGAESLAELLPALRERGFEGIP